MVELIVGKKGKGNGLYLQGPSHLGLLLLTVIYRDCVKWVCLAVGLFTGSVSFEFLLEKVREMCGFILTVI